MYRREFLRASVAAGVATAFVGLPGSTNAARNKELNILCWEGYNSGRVLDPFRKRNGATVIAETGTSDPDMIDRLRGGGAKDWDLINLNQPWARDMLWPSGLIRPLSKGRFEPYFFNMVAPFNKSYKWCYSEDGRELLGMPQRFGTIGIAVNTDKISRATAEDEGYDLFNEPSNRGRFGILTYENINIYHMCIGAGVDPFKPHDESELRSFEATAHAWAKGAKLASDDFGQLNAAMANGEIDFYLTGGTYTLSAARFEGATNFRGITPKHGPMDGKGGTMWVEVTSLVNNPEISPLAEAFLAYVQEPDAGHNVAFTEGVYNPVVQMGNPRVFDTFTAQELDAIQWDSLEEDLSYCVDFQINPDFDAMSEIYRKAMQNT